MSGGMGSSQRWNRYSYVSGDPVNKLDRNGLIEEPVAGCGAPGTEYCIDDAELRGVFGSGGGSIPKPVAVPAGGDMNSEALQLIEGALNKMAATRCGSVFSRLVGLDSISKLASKVDFYDARRGSPMGGLTQDNVSGNGVFTALQDTGNYGDDAVVLISAKAGYLPKVILKTNWFSAGKSGFALVHEVLHYGVQSDDAGLMALFSTYGFLYDMKRSPFGFETGQLTTWFKNGCPDMRIRNRTADGGVTE